MHHHRGVPPDPGAVASLGVLVTREPRLVFGGDGVDIVRARQRRDADAGLASPFEQPQHQVPCPLLAPGPAPPSRRLPTTPRSLRGRCPAGGPPPRPGSPAPGRAYDPSSWPRGLLASNSRSNPVLGARRPACGTSLPTCAHGAPCASASRSVSLHPRVIWRANSVRRLASDGPESACPAAGSCALVGRSVRLDAIE